jgi:hypothetical protein
VEWWVAVAAVVLTGVVLVGLFAGPSNHPAPPAPPTESAAPRTAPVPVVAPTDKVLYQLPPAANRLEDRTRLMSGHARRRARTRP